jgi:hypothetical protein
MKTYAVVAIVMGVLAMDFAVRAQDCTSPVLGWNGHYAISVIGSATAQPQPSHIRGHVSGGS